MNKSPQLIEKVDDQFVLTKAGEKLVDESEDEVFDAMPTAHEDDQFRAICAKFPEELDREQVEDAVTNYYASLIA